MNESNTLSVVAEAMHLPSGFEVSIEGLEAGSQVTAGDVTLPEGAELAVDPEFVLAVVSQAQTAEQLEGDDRRGRGRRGRRAAEGEPPRSKPPVRRSPSRQAIRESADRHFP